MISWQPGMKLDDLEKLVILHAFQFYEKNKTKTANALGIAVRTIDNKLLRYKEEDIKQKAKDAKRAEAGKAERAKELANMQSDQEATNANSKKPDRIVDSASRQHKDIHSGSGSGNKQRGTRKSVPDESDEHRPGLHDVL